MIFAKRARFAPPSNGFWSKLFDSPLSDLFLGRVTGRCNVRRIIAGGNLPGPVAEGIWSCVWSSRRDRSRRWELAAELTRWSQQQFSAGRTIDDVAAELHERAALCEMVDGKAGASARIV